MANSIASNETVTKVLDTNANPAPLGLMGFALTTILLNIHNAGLYELNAMILSIGIFYGGISQLIAGIMEWKKNNTFGTLAFISYGAFWLTLVFLWLIPGIFPDLGPARGPSETAMAWFFVFWGIFSGYMFIATLKLNRALQAVFGLLTILFFLLAIRDFGGGAYWGKIAGWEGILTGLVALYAAAGQILNEVYRRVVLPLGPVSHLPKGFVANHGEEIVRMWLDDIRRSPQTPTYATVAERDLLEAGEFALAKVDKCFSGDSLDAETVEYFYQLGKTRAAQGLPVAELVSAILLFKHETWVSSRQHGVFESVMDLRRAVDLNRELGRFFDKAAYYAVAGYTGQPLEPTVFF